MSIKNLGYRLFGFMFGVFRVFPIKENKVFLIATHDDSKEGNIAVAAAAIQKKRPDMRFVWMRKKDKASHPVTFFLKKAYHMATSSIILLDNVFMPMAYTHISPKVRVIQLWHGTGTIKKFGLDSDGEEVARIAREGNKRITWLTVNGERTREQYRSAFGIEPGRIRMTGLPRTDLLLDEGYMKKARLRFLGGIRGKISEPEVKRYVLYAPTFRDSEADAPRLMLDLDVFLGSMPDDVILLLRFHPFVAKSFSNGEGLMRTLNDRYKKRVIDVSGYKGVTTLLSVADVLITDYSSIIFEYALTYKPMIFYAYDLSDFVKNGRDFYEKYEEFVPGAVAQTEKELIRETRAALFDLDEGTFDTGRIRSFVEDNYKRADGHAADRVADLALRQG